MRQVLGLVVAAVLAATAGCAEVSARPVQRHSAPAASTAPSELPSAYGDLRDAGQDLWRTVVPAQTTQVVRTVTDTRWCTEVYCTVTQAWQRDGDTWRLVKELRSTIGPHGWGKTREGDLMSPIGVFTIVTTFSTGPRETRMPWRRRLPTTTVSDEHGATYNTWIEEPGRTDGARPSMRYGFIIDYNHVRMRAGQGPVPDPGAGSGIFYHTSRPGQEWIPTDGCTQLGNPADMRWLLGWLRPEAQPRVVQSL